MEFRLIAAAALLVAAPLAAMAQPAKISKTTTPEVALTALMAEGCAPYLLDKTPLAVSFKGRGRAVTLRGDPGVLLPTAEPIGALEQNGGCYVRVDKGDGAVFREAVIKAVAGISDRPLRTVSDGGPAANDGRGRYRQEIYCFGLKGKTAAW